MSADDSARASKLIATPTIVITGGAGFIGSELVRQWLATESGPVVVLDKFTYAGSREALATVASDPRLTIVAGDIGDRGLVSELLARHRPQAIVNLAAETHVDRSIIAPAPFVETNVVGTWQLLEGACDYWRNLPADEQGRFRFVQGSTDEVYGDLPEGVIAQVGSPYAPSSPYAAAKAAADHWVRSYHRTYGLPTIVVCSTNNYGPFQIPEKLIPVVVTRALAGQPIPVYGDGLQRRDWLHVADNCAGLKQVVLEGKAGRTYHLASERLTSNLELVGRICDTLDRLVPAQRPRRELLTHVADRPGHDRRYVLDAASAHELGWRATTSLEAGLEATVRWYLEHPEWVEQKLAVLANEREGRANRRS